MKKTLLGSNLFLTLVIPFILLSCNNEKESRFANPPMKNNWIVSIDPTSISTISISDLYNKVEIIPLETSSKSIIQSISKIEPFENNFYILDQDQNALFIFDSCGKFINKIQNTGNGPGEYSLLYDFDINPFTKNLELLNPRGELLTYSKNGSFISSIKIPLKAPQWFVCISEDLILFYSLYDQNKLAYFSREKGTIILSRFEFPDLILKTPLITGKSSPFYKYNSSIIFFQGFSNEIYSINKTQFSLRLKWDFDKNNLKLSTLLPGQPVDYYPITLRNSNFVHSFNYYIENDIYIYTRYMFNKNWNTLILNKSNSEYQIIYKFKELIVPPAHPVFFENGIMATIDPMKIQILVTESILDEKNREVFRSVKPEDNPVIVKYYFK